jgi:hypothetical protein
MTEAATFFRNREQDPGATYQFQVKTGKLLYRFSVYSRKLVESKTLSDQEYAGKKEADAALSDLRSTLSTLGGGGLIVMVLDQGGLRHLSINPVASGGFQVPRQFVVLVPGRPAYSLAIDDKDQEFPAGAHFIVPVDAAAEERLQLFIGQLPWFSPDLEALVLRAIRRPALDARMDRVETKLFGQTADTVPAGAETGWFARTKERIGRRLASPAFYGYCAALLLALLLAANAFLLLRLKSTVDDLATRVPQPPVTSLGPAPTPGPTPAPSPPIQPPAGVVAVAQQTKDLFAALREKSDPNLKLLYNAHFKDFDKNPLADQEIASWFSRQQSGQAGSRPFLLGIIKLQALELQPQPADTSFLQKWDNITATKEVFRNLGLNNFDATKLRLVAGLSCQLGYDSPQAPGLPGFGQGSPPLEFIPGGSCSSLTVNDIETGLDDLVEFVEHR